MLKALDRFSIPRNEDARRSVGPLRFGFDYLNHQLVKNGAEQAVIRMMRQYRAGGLFLREIAGNLNQGLIPTKQNGVWQANTIRGILARAGYLSYGPDAANVLFHVVNLRHLRHRPMVFTTNKSPLTAWGEVLHDHDLAEAIVDRVLEKGRLLLVDGPSYRTRHLKLDNTEQPVKDVARVSGKTAAIISGTHGCSSRFRLPRINR